MHNRNQEMARLTQPIIELGNLKLVCESSKKRQQRMRCLFFMQLEVISAAFVSLSIKAQDSLMQKTKRILCVEDHKDICELITNVLESYKIIGVHTKVDAIKKITTERFDLYLLDYHLPDGTGLELCEFIRSSDKFTPIYFSTGTSSLSFIQAKKAGAQGVIKQGIGFVDALINTVSGIFGDANE